MASNLHKSRVITNDPSSSKNHLEQNIKSCHRGDEQYFETTKPVLEGTNLSLDVAESRALLARSSYSEGQKIAPSSPAAIDV